MKLALKIIVPLVAVASLAFYSLAVAGSMSVNEGANADKYRYYQFFASSTAPSTVATTTSAVSTSIIPYFDSEGRLDNGTLDIRGAEQVTVFFSRGGATGPNTGSSLFKIQVTPDGSRWLDYKDLRTIDAEIGANSVYGTRTGSSTIAAATSTTMFTMDAKGFRAIRCHVTETTDGEHACAAAVQY